MTDPKGHVFLVDDSPQIREHLTALLQRYGYSVSTYVSAEDFIDRDIAISPAALVLDVRLPGLSGVELRKKLNEVRRGLPTIFMSGNSHQCEIIEAFARAPSSSSGSRFPSTPSSKPSSVPWKRTGIGKTGSSCPACWKNAWSASPAASGNSCC